MAIENLKNALPDYAKDLKLNIGTLLRDSTLTEQQLWGAMAATAAATRVESVIVEVVSEAKEHLDETALKAALGAASIMGMNNVFYRARHFLHGAYDDLRAGLRMNIIGSAGGVAKADFELWSLAVSAINGCEQCLDAHEATVRREGISREQVYETLRIAAVMSGIGQAITLAETVEA
ncbi:carboxymuconolactone decarboxylase family protein [Pseudoclavibacter sp. 13-3]|uniref:carboxymuconolactone decarboxylase family protein n=1 Tax=Pseudoclavibacter sp. 13-3 TaxID=2901228 RepID=UPI001E47FFFB|nr:carboxymuconolactone decarboxylase family protein [Pseudoclavibacter sp. 13-3]MCD7102112.1 carboxymuconolactone decarboxylase family protein [Pseudoclavibacter sp. 13-3]